MARKLLIIGAPGGIRTPNPQIRRSIKFPVISSRSVFLSTSHLPAGLVFVWFRLVFDQSGSRLVANGRRESRLNPQIDSLIVRKKRHRNGTLKRTATAVLPVRRVT